MNPEIINDDRPAKRQRSGGGRAFHSRLESFTDFIREQRQQRRTWQEIAMLLRTEKGCAITYQGLHQFYRRHLKRQARPHWESEAATTQPAKVNPSASITQTTTTEKDNPFTFNTI
jgi:isopropylmalate/homocitrate/citramalate synthase